MHQAEVETAGETATRTMRTQGRGCVLVNRRGQPHSKEEGAMDSYHRYHLAGACMCVCACVFVVIGRCMCVCMCDHVWNCVHGKLVFLVSRHGQPLCREGAALA